MTVASEQASVVDQAGLTAQAEFTAATTGAPRVVADAIRGTLGSINAIRSRGQAEVTAIAADIASAQAVEARGGKEAGRMLRAAAAERQQAHEAKLKAQTDQAFLAVSVLEARAFGALVPVPVKDAGAVANARAELDSIIKGLDAAGMTQALIKAVGTEPGITAEALGGYGLRALERASGDATTATALRKSLILQAGQKLGAMGGPPQAAAAAVVLNTPKLRAAIAAARSSVSLRSE